MAGQTSFLKLALPALGEFQNGWNQPINQDFEDIDSWASDLYESLVGNGSAISTYSALRGSMDSLAARLAVGVGADGALILSSSPEIKEMAVSPVYGDQGSAAGRESAGDLEVYAARSPIPGDRFSSAAPVRGDLDTGIAHRLRTLGLVSAKNVMDSPHRSMSHGLVSVGTTALLNGIGFAQVALQGIVISAPSSWPVFNIDGYIFRLRESIIFDYSALAGLSPGDTLWFYVERVEASYGAAAFKYCIVGDTDPTHLVAKDLRKLQSGTHGATGSATNQFGDATAHFNGASLLGQVQPGDELVILAGDNAGVYPIASVDSAIQVTVVGEFPNPSLSGIAWYIWDPWHPNIGVERVSSATALPSYVPGRAYIGKAVHASPGAATVYTFTPTGVYDTGWVSTTATGFSCSNIPHNLGTLPTQIEVWFRLAAGQPEYKGMVVRSVLVSTVPASIDVTLPTTREWADDMTLSVVLINQASPADCLFTDSSNAVHASGEVRIIARR